MAQLQYGELIFHLATIRTAEYRIEPVRDPMAALNWECSKVSLEVVGICNAVTIATNKPIPGLVDGIQNPGDGLPFTMHNIRDYLMKPRRYLSFTVADVVILEVPKFVNDAVQLECDVKGGPFPRYARFDRIMGEKSAVLSFSVECYDSDCDQIVLSNMWSVTCDTDNYGMTTRTIRGAARFRKDYLVFEDLQPDDFRSALVVPGATGMRRVGISVDEGADGTSLDYAVVDREVAYGLGTNGDCLEIRGTVTSGVEYPIKDPKALLGAVGGIAGNVVQDVVAGPGGWMKLAGRIWDVAVPVNKNTATVRAYGRFGADRGRLTRVATGFAIDRLNKVFSPAGGLGACVSAWCTHNLDSESAPWCEIKMDVMGLSTKIVANLFSAKPENLINISPTYTVGGENFGPNTLTPRMFASSNTRGTWLGRMVIQSLMSPDTCAIPAEVPTHQASRDETSK